MLGPGRYLLGVLEVLLLGGFAWLGGDSVRRWLLPRFEGAPAYLAGAVVGLALLIWGAELLGAFGWWEPVPYLVIVAAAGLGLWRFLPSRPEGEGGHPHPTQQVGVRVASLSALIAFLVAAVAVIRFALEAKGKLSTGMTGFDSTWYHGPFAAGFFQSGDTWDLHFIAPQFLAWFYPANAEIFHAAGMLAFGRDVLSPLLNIGWFIGCLAACWCIGRPYRVAPWSLALGAIALSIPALADQAGEARNDIVGIFFLLSAVALALNAWGGSAAERTSPRIPGTTAFGSYLVVGLSAGLAAGTKLNFLLPAGVLVLGLALVAPRGARGRAVGAAALAALAGGGYWYLRNLVHSGNPLPWIHHLGPIDLPAPEQALGGREAHSVLSYLGDGSVWSDRFLPGLHDGLWLLWPLLVAAALIGLILVVLQFRGSLVGSGTTKEPRNDLTLAVAGAVGLATALAWLIAPTSASGPDGMPRGFESGLRYLAPALVLGLALLPVAPPARTLLLRPRQSFPIYKGGKLCRGARDHVGWLVGIAVLAAIAVGYPVQRHYLEGRYKDPSFTSAPGLNAAFAWARDVSDARIATTSTRQYPLFGTDLSNHVQYLGLDQLHGGFEAPPTCRQYLRLLNEGDYDYAVATRDRLEPGKPPYPPQVRWTEATGAKVVLKKPPTAVLQLPNNLGPSPCKRSDPREGGGEGS
jgi:hypothetical protein